MGVMNWFVELVELSMTRAKTVCPVCSLPRPLKTSKCSDISNNSSCHVSNSASLYFFFGLFCECARGTQQSPTRHAHANKKTPEAEGHRE